MVPAKRIVFIVANLSVGGLVARASFGLQRGLRFFVVVRAGFVHLRPLMAARATNVSRISDAG